MEIGDVPSTTQSISRFSLNKEVKGKRTISYTTVNYWIKWIFTVKLTNILDFSQF